MHSRWLHWKGGFYLVLGTGTHAGTSEEFVIYRPEVGPYRLFVRPLAEWEAEVQPGVRRFSPVTA